MINLKYNMKFYLHKKDVTSVFQLRYNKILDLTKLGELKAVQICMCYRFTKYDLHEFIERNLSKPVWQ